MPPPYPAPNFTRRCSGLPGWVPAAGGTGMTRTCHPVPELGPAGDKQPWLERREGAGRRRRRGERKVSLNSSKSGAAAALKPGGRTSHVPRCCHPPWAATAPKHQLGVLKVLPLPLPTPVSLTPIPRAQHAKNRVVTRRIPPPPSPPAQDTNSAPTTSPVTTCPAARDLERNPP